MMNYKKLIENVDKSESNRSDVDLMQLGEREFDKYDIPWLNHDQTPLKSYWYARWICTDTWVGGLLYFFEDEFVALSWQSARKSYEEFYWVSKEAYEKVGNYLESIRQVEHHMSTVNFLEDLEEEIHDGYQISYGSMLLPIHYKVDVTFKGRTGKIVKSWPHHNEDVKKWRNVVIEFEDDKTTLEVSLEDVVFPYFLKD